MADSRTSHHSRIQLCVHHHLRHYKSSRSATKTNHAAATTPRLLNATTTTDPFIIPLGADLHQFISRGSFTAAAPPLTNKGSEPPLLQLHREPPCVSQKHICNNETPWTSPKPWQRRMQLHSWQKQPIMVEEAPAHTNLHLHHAHGEEKNLGRRREDEQV
ncbi:hypothetical protein DEO72_LG11g1191 [Vigna unguiculata]|uniref:Uncharacterized protein n=1 Tax=Vigna unguiculata TaxID=3917 RepID=A0A4D6NMH8_VIGUN|nr:hypothetical protein DEO72_LG11g1191 [Vigna unguiculata]